MSNTKGEPTVPLSVAEMLYVCLATAQQSAQLDDRTKENVGLILATYRVRRDVYVKSQGYDDIDVKHYVEAAAEALANWLDDRALKADNEVEQADFEDFEKEFGESEAKDPHQYPLARRERAGEDHDGARGADPQATSGGGRSPDGGTLDPGVAQPPTDS